ncbi:MAG TPA: hypothetical protein VG186_02390 [Solirubrobacteraceae bacterium]|nr:hypothetical protein [Solirubrobacteraceae bacterium]
MSQHTDIIGRLRDADPARVTPIENAALFASIIADPADPGFHSRRHRAAGSLRRWRQRHTGRKALIAVALVVTLSGAAGLTTIFDASQYQHVSAFTLFSGIRGDSPRGIPGDPLAPGHTDVIRASVKRLETFQIPDFGALQYWVAQTKSGDWCAAFRLPDGVWAGTIEDPKYSFGGIASITDCTPPASGESAGPHFTYSNSSFSLTSHSALPGPRDWTVAYGIVRNLAGAARVRDATAGVSTPVLNGHDFALLIPNHLALGRDTPGGCSCGAHTKIWFSGPIRLEALNAAGHVIARARVGP